MLRRLMTGLVAFVAIIGSFVMLTACSSGPSAKKLAETDVEVLYQGTVVASHVKSDGSDQLVFRFTSTGGYNVKLEGNDLTKDFNFSPRPRHAKHPVTVSGKNFPIKITVTKQGSAPETATIK